MGQSTYSTVYTKLCAARRFQLYTYMLKFWLYIIVNININMFALNVFPDLSPRPPVVAYSLPGAPLFKHPVRYAGPLACGRSGGKAAFEKRVSANPSSVSLKKPPSNRRHLGRQPIINIPRGEESQSAQEASGIQRLQRIYIFKKFRS
jgi:hypothetical protein